MLISGLVRSLEEGRKMEKLYTRSGGKNRNVE
jgi:hypothetical protein